MSNLAEERMTRPDAGVLRSEMQLTAKMLKHACRRGLALIQKPVDSANESFRNEWVEIIEEYKRLWLIRNRPGGMEDSVHRMELILFDYE